MRLCTTRASYSIRVPCRPGMFLDGAQDVLVAFVRIRYFQRMGDVRIVSGGERKRPCLPVDAEGAVVVGVVGGNERQG